MHGRRDALALDTPFGLGRGVVEVVTIPDPGAQANWSRRTGSGYLERYLGIFTILTSDATVANRQVAIEYRNADGVVFTGTAGGVLQTASNIFRYYFAITGSLTTSAASARQTASLPNVFMEPGFQIATLIGGFQATDTLTSTAVIVERFPIGDDGYEFGTPVENIDPALEG